MEEEVEKSENIQQTRRWKKKEGVRLDGMY